MASRARKKAKVDPENSQLCEGDIRLLLLICTELVNFCVKITRKIDPSAAAMLAYVRDDIRLENELQWP